jgi:CrcB protein
MARYGISMLMSKVVNTPFPFATFLINVLGSLLIGVLFGLAARNQWLQAGGMLLLASGFCGGFTTFSTFALENINLMQKGQSMVGILYIAASLVIGLLFCRLGILLTS